MMILSILAAPNPKRAVLYNPKTDDLIFELADIIGLIAMENPDDPEEMTYIPMYMISDDFGGYNLPQMDVRFIEFVNPKDDLDLGKYTQQIEEIKELITKMDEETVEVTTTGNVSQIKRFIRYTKPETPKDEN